MDRHFKPIMQIDWLYIKGSADLTNKTILGTILDNAILFTADVVKLYPSMPHKAGLRALREV